jgi:hypothetical protein
MTRCPWYLAGPLLGLFIVGLRATLNKPLTGLGGFIDLAENAAAPWRLGYRAFLLFGFALGGALFAATLGSFSFSLSYGTAGGLLPGAALGSGWIAARYGLRPEPFYPGVAFAAIGLALSVLLVRGTSQHAALESALTPHKERSPSEVFWETTLRDPNLSSVSQAGLVNNLNDGMAWGLFPLFFAAANINIERIGLLAAIYPATWGIAQLGTGALSDKVGRKWLIASGMWVQAIGIAAVILASGFAGFMLGSVLLGLGTAMVYPMLLAAIGDVAHPSWRASSVGVYRLWRDLGYAIGALVAGLTADALGLRGAMCLVATLTFASGLVAAFRMSETKGDQHSHIVPDRLRYAQVAR